MWNRLTAEVPVLDGCPALTRLKCFITQLGVVPIIQHVFRDDTGRPLDLSEYFPTDSASESSSVAEPGQVLLRSREIVSNAGPKNPVIQVEGTVTDPLNGIAEFQMTGQAVRLAGIYQLSIALFSGTQLLKIEQPILWIERSLFRMDSSDIKFNQGPPTLQEIRQTIMDSHSAENSLLDDVEFHTDQIAHALVAPVRLWNEIPPPIVKYDTRTFPFTELWKAGVVAQLFLTAAHNYRRNTFNIRAGDVMQSDKDKEDQYLRIGQAMWTRFVADVKAKKVELNIQQMYGNFGSTYSNL